MAERLPDGAFVAVWDRWNLLLVLHNYGQQKWSLPGGGIEPDETPEKAATRETAEETGQLIAVTHHLGTFQLLKSPGSVYLLEAELSENKLLPFSDSPEITQAAFLPPEVCWEKLYPAQQKLVAWAAYLRKLRNGNPTHHPHMCDLVAPPENPLFAPIP